MKLSLFFVVSAFFLLTAEQETTKLKLLIIQESEQDRLGSRLHELNKLDTNLLRKGGWSDSDLKQFASNNDNVYQEFSNDLKRGLSKLDIEADWITFSPDQSFEKYDLVLTMSCSARITKGGQVILLTVLNLYDFPQQPILIDSNWKSVKRELKRRIN